MKVISIGVAQTTQVVLADEGQDEGPKFLWNRATLNKGAKVIWVSYLGPKDKAETFKYTLQIKVSENVEEYLLEGTRRCEPCDLSHQEMKEEMSGIVVGKKSFEKAADGDDYVHVNINIQKVWKKWSLGCEVWSNIFKRVYGCKMFVKEYTI